MVGAIDLLRHGETGEGGFRGSLDDPLTPPGREQMRAAVREAGPWNAIVSSPLIRCAAFAQELARRRSIPLYLDTRLRELHFGLWEGCSAAELMQTQPEALTRFWADPYAHPPPGAEPLHAFERRVLDAWEALIQRHGGHRVLVVTHGGVIRMILRHVRGLPRSALLRIEVPHASLHRIVVPGPGMQDTSVVGGGVR